MLKKVFFSTCAHACVGHLGNSEARNKDPDLDLLHCAAGWSNMDSKQGTSMLFPTSFVRFYYSLKWLCSDSLFSVPRLGQDLRGGYAK